MSGAENSPLPRRAKAAPGPDPMPAKTVTAATFQSDVLESAAKIDVDTHPSLPATFGVRGIPALFLIRNGEVVASRTGAMPVAALRKF